MPLTPRSPNTISEGTPIGSWDADGLRGAYNQLENDVTALLDEAIALKAQLDAMHEADGLHKADSIDATMIELANNTALTTRNAANDADKALIKLATDNYLRIGQMPISNDGTVTATDNILMVSGWSKQAGNGTTALTFNISFGITFASTPIVIASYAGGYSGTGATSLSQFNANSQNRCGVNVSTTGCTIVIDRTSVYSSAAEYAVSWIAIGTKA